MGTNEAETLLRENSQMKTQIKIIQESKLVKAFSILQN